MTLNGAIWFDDIQTKTYDCLGQLRGIQTGNIQNLGYSFDEETGNLISRKDKLNNLTEIFSYDNLGRLTDVSGPSPISMNYANNGNINSKTSIGIYSYGAKPHAVTEVTNPSNLISTNEQKITYTSFNKADTIVQSTYKYILKYGAQDQRTISKLFVNDTLQKTVYYNGLYEKELVRGNTYPKEIHYIYGGDGIAAILKRQSGTDTMYYVHKDHLGSLDKLTNFAGVVVQKTSFDAWGRRRNPDNWTYSNIPTTLFSRGYTGHEHLDQFELINMNGRIYDPLLGRFLNPDPITTDPYFTQGFNKYSYVLNNPLKYTDPSGYYKRLDDPSCNEERRVYRGIDGGGNINFKAFGESSFGSNWFNDFTIALQNGFQGGINSFLWQYEAAKADPNYKGTITLTHYIDYYSVVTQNGKEVSPRTFLRTEEFTTTMSLDNSSGFWDPNLETEMLDQLASTAGLIMAAGYSISESQINSDIKALQKSGKASKPFFDAAGKYMGYISLGLDIKDLYNNTTWGNFAIIVLDVGTIFVPYAGQAYGIVDLGFALGTNASLSDRIGAEIDQVISNSGGFYVPINGGVYWISNDY